MNNVVQELAGLEGPDLLAALIRDRFPGRIALVSSFGTESAVLLHMAAAIDPRIPVIFLDTGKHFVETKAYRQALVERLGLADVRIARPRAADLAQHDPHGSLNAVAPDLCCHIRKTLPLAGALDGFAAWISGRKRFHGGERAKIATLAWQDGRLKADPLANYGSDELDAYMRQHDLPPHPLAEKGYASVGCMSCTTKSAAADGPRSGRWAGRAKSECGIHWTANGRLVRITAPVAALPQAGC